MYVIGHKQTCRYRKQTNGHQWGEKKQKVDRSMRLRDINYFV